MAEVEASFRELFVQEARQRLDRMGEYLLRLEREPGNRETVTGLFREAHTLKGGAAMVGATAVRRIAHAMEDVLEQLRAGGHPMSVEGVDVMLASVDAIRAALGGVEGAEATRAGVAEMEGRLRALVAAAPAKETAGSPTGEAVTATAPTVEAGAPVPTIDAVQVSVERLDELVRAAGESAAAHLRLGRMIGARLEVDPGELTEFRDLERVLNQLQDLTMRVRMVPVATLGYRLHRAIRQAARGESKSVRWEMTGGDTELDRGVLERLADPLLHLVRNAVDHGIESPAERAATGKAAEGVIRLHAMQLGSEVIIAITDDGRGIDLARVREEAARRSVETAGMSDDDVVSLVFLSGLTTAGAVTELSGRGVGLDVVRSTLESMRGRVEVRTQPGKGSEFRLAVPITLAVIPCMLVSCAGQRLAIPIHSVIKVLQTTADRTTRVDRRHVVMVDGQPIPISSLAETLEMGAATNGPVMVLAGLSRSHGFRVDALLGQRDLVIKGLSGLVPRLDLVAGASVEPDGSIIVVLEASRLVDRAREMAHQTASSPAPPRGEGKITAAAKGGRDRIPEKEDVLVVDDAMTVRELQRSILERAGYRVRTATNGAEALAMLAAQPSTLVLTDLEMPEMDGFALIEAMRRHPRLKHVPVIILSTRGSEVDRRRGLEAGADAYIVKSAFDQAGLISAINRLLGKAA
jgi:two-component system chemotaxis sensor kinase CheA